MTRTLLTPLALVALFSALLCSPAAAAAWATDADVPVTTLDAAKKKLRSISDKPVQLWVVVHVRAHKTLKPDGTVDEERLIADALQSSDAVVKGGGDAIILINSRCELPLYTRVIAAVRERYPKVPLGISALAYGPENLTDGFALAKRFDAKIVWMEVVPGTTFEYEVDDEGHYARAEVTPRSLARQVMQSDKPDAMLVAGVHMKYTRNLDGRSFQQSMRRALGGVDGINITGVRTGVLADVERVRRARKFAGEWPMGLASGVSVDNIAGVIDFIDYAIVGTSLKVPGDPLHTSEARVRALREKMDALSRGR
jgi:predicted TIM-barrel enzyme